MKRSHLVGWSVTFLVMSWVVPASHAQSSDGFRRERAALERDAQSLKGWAIDLNLRRDAQATVRQQLQKELAEINAMPPGIGRDAAVTGFNRKNAEYARANASLGADINRFAADKADYDRRVREYNRRVGAAKSANKFQPGETALVLWRGRWWNARLLRAENGSYYVTYPGYGPEWNEWVGDSRIRRR